MLTCMTSDYLLVDFSETVCRELVDSFQERVFGLGIDQIVEPVNEIPHVGRDAELGPLWRLVASKIVCRHTEGS